MKKVALLVKPLVSNDGIANMEDPVKTARELATHANEIKHLQQDMDRMVQDMDEIKKTLNEIKKTLSEARGGWRVLMYVGGAGGVLGGSLTWLAEKFIR
jgi:prefoldin subunit 5